MTDTVRIMPRQPIEAKRDEFGEGYYVERGTSIILRDYLNSGGVGWVEVSDPIVWDGSDYEKDFEAWLELSIRIEAELGEGYFVAETWRLDCLGIFRRIPRDQRCDPQDDSVLVGILTPGARIRIEGDTFSIHPPKDGDA